MRIEVNMDTVPFDQAPEWCKEALTYGVDALLAPKTIERITLKDMNDGRSYVLLLAQYQHKPVFTGEIEKAAEASEDALAAAITWLSTEYANRFKNVEQPRQLVYADYWNRGVVTANIRSHSCCEFLAQLPDERDDDVVALEPQWPWPHGQAYDMSKYKK